MTEHTCGGFYDLSCESCEEQQVEIEMELAMNFACSESCGDGPIYDY